MLLLLAILLTTKDYSDNKWWKQTAKPEKEVTSLKDQFKPEPTSSANPEPKTTYKAIGKEVCGNLNCFKYQIMDPAAKDTTEYIWFDDREYLLRKEMSQSKDGTSTTEFSYNNVNISAPSPTKDAKPDQIIVPNGAAIPGMSEQDRKKLEDEAKKAQQEIQNSAPANPPEPVVPQDDSGSSQ